jgi:hypothetical protein
MAFLRPEAGEKIKPPPGGGVRRSPINSRRGSGEEMGSSLTQSPLASVEIVLLATSNAGGRRLVFLYYTHSHMK